MSQTPGVGGRVERRVPRVPVRAHQAAGDALDQLLLVHVEHQQPVDLAAVPLQLGIERLGLRDVAREAVEQEAALRVGLRDAVDQHLDHQRVGHELAGLHEVLRAPAELRAVAQVRAQHVAGGDVRQPELGGEPWCLRPLPRAGRAEDQQVPTHASYFRKPS